MIERLSHVSIILLNYNGWRDTIECIESLLKVNYHLFDIIIVDNKSTDESETKIKNYILQQQFKFIQKNEYTNFNVATYNNNINNIYFINSFENLGFSGGNNLGINYALKLKSEFIMLLNNDCIVKENFLTPLVDSLKENKNIGISSGKIYEYDNHSKYISGGYISKLKASGYHYFNDEVKNTNKITFLSGCLWLIRANVFKTVGLLDENYFLYIEDVDFCYRVQKKGFKLVYAPESEIFHKESQSTGKNSPQIVYYNTRNRLYFVNKFYKKKCIKILFYLFFIISRSIKIIQNPHNFDPIRDGIKDYLNCVYGKYTK